MNTVDRAMEYLKRHERRFAEAADLQMRVWNGERVGRQPLLLSCDPCLDVVGEYQSLDMKEIHFDSNKMLLSGLWAMVRSAAGGMEAVPSIRANMGCGVFATLFPGVEQELFGDKMPWIQKHLSKETISEMSTSDIYIGKEFQAGLDHMAYMVDKLTGTGCMVYPMDLQGPFDIAHLVYGDAIFYDIYDDPGFVHHLLELSCEAIFKGMAECLRLMPESDVKVAHYNGLVVPRAKGGIKTSEDTSTLLSKEHIDEFVAPYLSRVLTHFGGGWVHYCGRNEHLFEAIMREPMARGINFGNPEMHDMECVLRKCAAADKLYYGAIPKGGDQDLFDYFTDLLVASERDDRCHLILTYTCKRDERDTVRMAWEVIASRN